MNLGYIILCRYNSSRFPGKILKTINGKTILEYIIERISIIVSKKNIVVATSVENSDDPIEDFCKDNHIQYYRGSLKNVAERFLACGKEYKFDYAARINGDNLFVDLKTLEEMNEITLKYGFDFVSNVKNRTFPKGMSIEIVKTSFYNKILQKFTDERHFEHVTLFLYENDKSQNFYYHYNKICPEAAGIQMAIDTKDDFILSEKIINKFEKNHTEYGLKDIFEIRKKILNEQF